ncbi:MAG: transglutaminase-like domain-containing protein [Bacteroidia bacterium]|nr:transglutaminase-like domain-containing protein [Bacteroidia bacterium]
MKPATTEQLPYLLHLLEDPSPAVRSEVRGALSGFGHFLRPSTREWVTAQPEDVRLEWDYICAIAEEKALKDSWLSWMLIDSYADQLEAGMMALEFGGSYSRHFIHNSLDELATEVSHLYPRLRCEDLMDYLFRIRGFNKTLREQTYLQHRLGYVLRYERGSQLGLGILAVILAEKVGLAISLVKIHGNWLILDQNSGENVLYNPETNGARLLRSEAMCIEEAYRRDMLMADGLSATAEEILLEVIESHLEGYKRSGLRDREVEMIEKHRDLSREIDRRHLVDFLID